MRTRRAVGTSLGRSNGCVLRGLAELSLICAYAAATLTGVAGPVDGVGGTITARNW